MGQFSKGNCSIHSTKKKNNFKTTRIKMKVVAVMLVFCVALSQSSQVDQDLAEKTLAQLLGDENVGAYMCAGLHSTICGKVEKCCERKNEAPGDFICCRPGETCDHYDDPENKRSRDCCCGAGTKCGPYGTCQIII